MTYVLCRECMSYVGCLRPFVCHMYCPVRLTSCSALRVVGHAVRRGVLEGDGDAQRRRGAIARRLRVPRLRVAFVPGGRGMATDVMAQVRVSIVTAFF